MYKTRIFTLLLSFILTPYLTASELFDLKNDLGKKRKYIHLSKSYDQEILGQIGIYRPLVGQRISDEYAERQVSVSLYDNMTILFDDENIKIGPGDVIEFKVTNKGIKQHGFSIWNVSKEVLHEKMIRSNTGISGLFGVNMLVGPGEIRSFTWQFSDSNVVTFSCIIPDHIVSGMSKIVLMTYSLKPQSPILDPVFNSTE